MSAAAENMLLEACNLNLGGLWNGVAPTDEKMEKIRDKGIEVVDEKTGYIKKIMYTEVDEYFNVPYLKKELEFLKNKI